MIFTETPLPGSYLIELDPFGDERGFFARLFCTATFEEKGLAGHWVQINNSFTRYCGTVRGMHFQYAPFMEDKMVRCISGAIWDVILDLRKGSPTYGQWFGAELDAAQRNMMYVPQGFAHGFQTLCDDVELLYFHSCEYQSTLEGGIHPCDPGLDINWPLPIQNLSGRDQSLPYFTNSFEGL